MYRIDFSLLIRMWRDFSTTAIISHFSFNSAKHFFDNSKQFIQRITNIGNTNNAHEKLQQRIIILLNFINLIFYGYYYIVFKLFNSVNINTWIIITPIFNLSS